MSLHNSPLPYLNLKVSGYQSNLDFLEIQETEESNTNLDTLKTPTKSSKPFEKKSSNVLASLLNNSQSISSTLPFLQKSINLLTIYQSINKLLKLRDPSVFTLALSNLSLFKDQDSDSPFVPIESATHDSILQLAIEKKSLQLNFKDLFTQCIHFGRKYLNVHVIVPGFLPENLVQPISWSFSPSKLGSSILKDFPQLFFKIQPESAKSVFYNDDGSTLLCTSFADIETALKLKKCGCQFQKTTSSIIFTSKYTPLSLETFTEFIQFFSKTFSPPENFPFLSKQLSTVGHTIKEKQNLETLNTPLSNHPIKTQQSPQPHEPNLSPITVNPWKTFLNSDSPLLVQVFQHIQNDSFFDWSSNTLEIKDWEFLASKHNNLVQLIVQQKLSSELLTLPVLISNINNGLLYHSFLLKHSFDCNILYEYVRVCFHTLLKNITQPHIMGLSNLVCDNLCDFAKSISECQPSLTQILQIISKLDPVYQMWCVYLIDKILTRSIVICLAKYKLLIPPFENQPQHHHMLQLAENLKNHCVVCFKDFSFDYFQLNNLISILKSSKPERYIEILHPV